MPRDLNHIADSMVSSTTCFQPCKDIPQTQYLVEVIFRPSILDNIGCWQVFEDERHVFNFLNCVNEFSSHVVDEV
jgi:hypothetical protein